MSLSSSIAMNPGSMHGTIYNHHSIGKSAVLNKSATAGTKVGTNRRSTLAKIPQRSHLFEKGLKVKADLFIDLALITKPKCTIRTAQNAAVCA